MRILSGPSPVPAVPGHKGEAWLYFGAVESRRLGAASLSLSVVAGILPVMDSGNQMFPGWIFPGPSSQDPADVLASLLKLPSRPLPDKLTPKTLREAIASALSEVKAYDLAEECVQLGLPPQADDEEGPWNGKWRYVERRIRHCKLPELLTLAYEVAKEYDDRDLNYLIALASVGGVRGEMKNLIFATTGPKPKIVLRDAINNDLEIVENGHNCLVYDRPLSETGLTWRQLTAWWARNDNLDGEEERAAARGLYARLLKSMGRNGAERFVFERYCARYGTHGFDVPALIPQVYLHYDPYTRRTGGILTRQRMDFLLLLTRHRRVVLEVDGIQHYADSGGRACPARYAEMVAPDRELRLAGYEVYRFGGHEITDRAQAASLLDKFFDDVLSDPELG